MADVSGGGRRPPWWQALPSAEAEIVCGPERHGVRWAAGALALPAHPDAEAELVSGARGGEKPACVEVAERWGRHRDDLEVLVLGPRSAADRLQVAWDDIEAVRLGAGPGGPWRFGTWPAARSGRPRRQLHPVHRQPHVPGHRRLA
jgi:hypothetical protein